MRTIVSRSGHELTFDDTPGTEKVTLRTQGGHELVLDDGPTGLQVTLSSNGGRRVVLDDRGTGRAILETPTARLTIDDAGGAVSLQAMGHLKIEAPIIELAANQITIGSAASATIIDHVPFKLHTHVHAIIGTNLPPTDIVTLVP